MTFHAMTRRAALAGIGAGLVVRATAATAQTPAMLDMEAVTADGIALLRPVAGGGLVRFVRGTPVAVTIANRLEGPLWLDWLGLDGAPQLQPWLARPAIAAGAADRFTLMPRHAGTLACRARGADGNAVTRPLTMAVTEDGPAVADRDIVLVVTDAVSGAPVLTADGVATNALAARRGERLRLRIINARQFTVIAIRFSLLQVTVLAFDGQPSEPFFARDGRVVLAPGTRIDAVVDMPLAASADGGAVSAIVMADAAGSRPPVPIALAGEPIRNEAQPAPAALPSNGLPAELDLRRALRVDVPLGGPTWIAPAGIAAAAPAFTAKRGRTVVLALQNAGPEIATFRLHGHHMRLLDRLDDGWKPFWLDTLAVPPGQTLRVAFMAENAGRYLLESLVGVPGGGPRLRSYRID